ncbi:hypothetical protein [Eubacterium limosum]|uniref:hypothetical protein n=1 Tax=Eubacterium limosum TaxID=1736 RepID=UPI00371ABAFB
MNPTEIKAELERLNKVRLDILKYQGPESVKSETSYTDADSIRGNHRRAAIDIFEEYQRVTDRMDALRQELKDRVDRFESLAEKVLFLVNVYGMTQKEAAEYLDYSYSHVRRIYSQAENDTNHDTFYDTK